jgi:flagellar biosynthesis protein FlhB
MADQGEKIFAPPPQRRQHAREQGLIARSRELTSAVSFAALAVIVASAMPLLGRYVLGVFAEAVAATGSADPGIAIRQSLVFPLGFVLAVSASLMLIAIGGAVAQGGLVFAPARLIPDFNRLNPARYFGRVFSGAGALDLVKAAAKLVLIVVIAWHTARAAFAGGAAAHGVSDALQTLDAGIRHLFYSCAALALVTAAADYAHKRYEHEMELRMTRQEFLDELKQEEGNPQIKRALRRAQRKRFKRARGIHQAAAATVVLTNPTHLAVALRYRRGFDQAPLVVAKGAGESAHRVVAIARLAAVPVIENKALARALFKGVDVGDQIPRQFYRAVAEVLAMIMRMQAQHRSSMVGMA